MKDNYQVDMANDAKYAEVSGAHRNIKYDFSVDGIEVYSEHGHIYIETAAEKTEYVSEADAIADADSLVAEWVR